MPLVTFDDVEHMLPGQGDSVFRVQNALNGVQSDVAVSPAVSTAYPLMTVSVPIPDAATTTYTYVMADKCELVDVIVRKSGAGAGNTIQITDATPTNITNAIAADTDKTITRAGTIDPAVNTLAAGASLKIVATRAAGSMLANVTLVLRRRP